MILVNGLPAHILLVHFVVVLVPLTALALVVCVIWPKAARRMGVALPLLVLVTLVSVRPRPGHSRPPRPAVSGPSETRRHRVR